MYFQEALGSQPRRFMREPLSGSTKLFIHKFHSFGAGKAWLYGSVSLYTLSHLLTLDASSLENQAEPTPEESGAALLEKTDLSEVEDRHLAAPVIKFPEVPENEDAMRKRIEWMFHAGALSADPERATRAHEAIDVIGGQIAPNGEFDPELLAENIALLADKWPQVVTALFVGDLDDVARLIDQADAHEVDIRELVRAAAWMFVCWGALEQQREASLGWRLRHVSSDGILAADGKGWTIAQTFSSRFEQYKTAHKFLELYNDNARKGIDRVNDKRTINSLEKCLAKIDKAELNAANEQEVVARFGIGYIPVIPRLLEIYRESADCFHAEYKRILIGADGKSRGGQQADMLSARITVVHRTAIVCARTLHLGSLAASATTTDDLRAMLSARVPTVLRPSRGKPREDKFRLRQLLYVIRLLFLRDGEHLPKKLKGSSVFERILPLDLDNNDRRRGHEILDSCWAELNAQPRDWQFDTPFGWQCSAGGAEKNASPRLAA